MKEKSGLNLLAKVGPTPALPSELTIADLHFEHKTAGLSGNNTTVEYATGGTAGSETVTVTGSDVKVTIDPGNSTARQIKTAIDNLPAANALLRVSFVGDPDAKQAIKAKTNLAFGYDAFPTARMFAGLQTKKITLGAEAIDVSNHSSDNYKTLLDQAGLRSFSMDAGGVACSEEVFDIVSIICERNLLQEFLLVDVANQITRKGKFKISSLEISADFKADQKFSSKMESSGRLSKNKATASEMDPTI